MTITYWSKHRASLSDKYGSNMYIKRHLWGIKGGITQFYKNWLKNCNVWLVIYFITSISPPIINHFYILHLNAWIWRSEAYLFPLQLKSSCLYRCCLTILFLGKNTKNFGGSQLLKCLKLSHVIWNWVSSGYWKKKLWGLWGTAKTCFTIFWHL